MPYAYTREIDPNTGDVRMNGAVHKIADSPMVEVVMRVLRTPRGTYLPDPSFGLDYSLARYIKPNTKSDWRAEVVRALTFLIDAKRIQELSVEVEIVGRQLRYQVSFLDPRMPGVKQTTKRLTITA